MRYLILAVAAALWALCWFAGGSWEVVPMAHIHLGDDRALAWFMTALTQAGGFFVLLPLSLGVAWWLWSRGRGGQALWLLGVTLSGRVLVELVKVGIARQRPADEHLVTIYSYSFPSAHAANSMLVFGALALLAGGGRWMGAALALIGAIGASRVLLGVHYPSDVIGGWAFGLFWLMLLHAQRQPARRE